MTVSKKIFLGFVITLFISCSSVPKQVVDAVQLQKTEIERVKKIYFDNINNQLDVIEKYRYAILNIYESQLIAKYSTTPTLIDENGKTKILEGQPTGDVQIDHININHLNKINNFFKTEREAIKKDIQNRKDQINLINKNFENIEQLNNALNEYMKSLKRLTNSQDKLAQSIEKKLEKIVPIPISISNIPDPTTIEDIINLFKKH